MTTSRKIGNRARRNRVKRRIREAARSHQLRLANWDSVILARESADNADFKRITGDLGELINELERRWEKQSESS